MKLLGLLSNDIIIYDSGKMSTAFFNIVRGVYQGRRPLKATRSLFCRLLSEETSISFSLSISGSFLCCCKILFLIIIGWISILCKVAADIAFTLGLFDKCADEDKMLDAVVCEIGGSFAVI